MTSKKQNRKKIVLLYHYFYPDTVASGRYFVQLAEDLAKKNYDVVMLTSNRIRMEPNALINLKHENWNEISIIRSHRPAWNQSKNIPRLLSSIVIMSKWLLEISKIKGVDSFVVGTNPELSQLMFPMIRMLKRGAKIYYWCFDLFPEAILADKKSISYSMLSFLLKPVLNFCYGFCDGILDLGISMRRRLKRYPKVPSMQTITPWALVEPKIDQAVSSAVHCNKLFGSADLKILYSGTLAKGHKFIPLVELARHFKSTGNSAKIAFACQGQRKTELEAYIKPGDSNISIQSFLPEKELDAYLSTPDFIAISIEEGWDGIILPSKFFGAIAMGKPVLFVGSHENEMAKWIKQYQLGVCLSNLHEIPAVSKKLLEIKQDKATYRSMSERCISIYRQKFSRTAGIEKWDRLFQFGPEYLKEEDLYQAGEIPLPSLRSGE